MRIALLGPPGSGKGTQAARICQTFGLIHLSSGDILRAERDSGSPTGLEIKEYMNSGKLVPDELTIRLIRGRIAALDKGFLLDGFPRTLPQAESLSKMLLELHRPLELVINFDVASDKLARRFEGRRMCSNAKCAAGYHVESLPPKKEGICDKCGSALIIRADDKPEVVQQRIATYEKSTAPLIAYYKQMGNFKTVDAAGSIDDVTKVVLEKIRRHFAD
jgi:adenylate kinase